MDSFFSLFDPSDGQNKQNHKKRHKNDQENAKKNADAPKGRRRGRRSQAKNEALPEESSFLCEPELGNEMLVKDCSYIESYMEVHKDKGRRRGRRSQAKNEALPEESSFLCEPEIDNEMQVKETSYIENYIDINKDKELTPKPEGEKKPRRRNSGRKNRRKKNKVSPGKDLLPSNAWSEDHDTQDTSWNNQFDTQRLKVVDIGKNVNDLHDYKNKRKNDSELPSYHDKVHNVIDKLDKISISDDFYLSGDFNAEDLENDFFYNSDDVDEYCDDTTSDAEDSGDECYGSLPPEPRFGNVEYKLQLVSPCERRFQHLVTQLKWRLRSGGGTAVYVVGVRDCGALRGLRARALRASLEALRQMSRALGAGIVGARARRVAPHRAVAEVYIRKLADPQQSVELRVAVLGANEAGKSTLIGVLTQGELDNGRGSARLNMFRHLHEVKSGRTSSLSHEILGFDAQGNVVNYGCSELMTAERIGERSAKLLSFLDLAGHSKYQRTTLHGLTGYSPHYAMCVISATAGITRITEEHIGLLLALDMPLFTVINKCELAPAAVCPLVDRLAACLLPGNKKPLLITDENMARNCVVQHKSILDTIDMGHDGGNKENESEQQIVPVFPVSCVRGMGLNALHAYLLALQPPASAAHTEPEDETCEFQIDEIFHVGDSTGPVVGGLLARGHLCEGDEMIIGPLDTGEFVRTSVATVYRNRVRCGSVAAGQSGSLGLGAAPPALRAGMVLLTVPGGASEINSHDARNKKNVRRRNKNLLHDIANAENKLTKEIRVDDNLYRADDEKDAKENVDNNSCDEDDLFLEDPNDPRGCIYFQASVHVLRHSTAIYPGFQCSVHVGNVRQTAIIEGILSPNNELRAGERASVVFRFARCPEYLVRGRRMLFTAGLGTRAIGRVTQVFPYVP